jgi:hypothetical protein
VAVPVESVGVVHSGPEYVNWSAVVDALVPTGVVTVTSTTPAPPGLVAVICVALLNVNAAAVVPNLTLDTPVKFVPVIVTEVPPAPGPVLGATEVTVAPDAYVYLSAAVRALMPPGVVTVTSTVPEPAGLVTVIKVSERTAKVDAPVPPNFTALAPVSPVPVT